MSDVIDLVSSPQKKRDVSATNSSSTSLSTSFASRLLAQSSLSGTKSTSTTTQTNSVSSSKHNEPKAKKAATGKPHVLLWICAAGKGHGRAWKAKALKVIGVYASKEAAETKKADIMTEYPCCGHGDIAVGGTW